MRWVNACTRKTHVPLRALVAVMQLTAHTNNQHHTQRQLGDSGFMDNLPLALRTLCLLSERRKLATFVSRLTATYLAI